MASPQRVTIRRRLLALVFSVALPLLASLAYYAYADFQSATRAARGSAKSLAQLTAADIRHFLDDQERLLARLAQRPAIRAMDRARCDSVFAGFPDFYPQFNNLRLIHLRGEVLCQAVEAGRGREPVAGREWFPAVAAAEQFSVSGVHFTRHSLRWIVILGYPVHDAGGERAGFLSLSIAEARFHPTLPDLASLSGAIVRVIGPDGRVVASSHEPERWVGRDVRGTEIVDIVLTQREGQTEARDPDGQERLWGFTRVPGTGWHVYAGIPSEAAFAPTRSAAYRSLALAFVIIGFVGLLAMRLGRQIERPIALLAGAAEAVAQGRLETRVSVEGPAEIAEVADQFNAMIEARARAEEDLRQSEQRYRGIFDQALTGNYVSTVAGRLLACNAAFARILGFKTAEGALGADAASFYPNPADRGRFLLDLREKGSHERDAELRRKDGTLVHVIESAIAILGEGDELREIQGSILDITARKQSAAALEESLSLLAATLESTADGLLVVDVAGRIRSYNRRFAELWRIPEAIVASRDDNRALAFVCDQLREPEAFLAKVRELYARPEAESFDVLEFKDGRCFERFSHPQRINETIVGRVWSFRDITEQRQAEAERARLQESLRRRETAAAMGDLVAGVAHEVRNPLFGISSTLDAFEARFGRREEHEQYVSILREQVERMNELMGDLLEYGKPIFSEFSPAPIRDVIAGGVHSSEPLAKQANVKLTNLASSDLAPVLMDASRLLLVFKNLVENGIQHCPPGGVVTVDAEEVLEGHKIWIDCLVKDPGPGFRTEDLTRVFEPFFTRRRGGTGLGLSVVRRIVEAHGGTVSVANQPGGGAVVTVRLPSAQAMHPVQGADETAEHRVRRGA